MSYAPQQNIEPRPVKWEIAKRDQIRRVHIELREQRDGSVLYAVTDGSGFVLAKDGNWEYEPQPSSRDDDFMARTRFASFDEALTAHRQGNDPNG